MTEISINPFGRDPRFKYREALADTGPINWIGSSIAVGMAVWFWTLLVYIRSSATDDLMKGTVPLGWVWSHLLDTTYGWSAVSYLCFWFLYVITDFVELIALFMMQSGGNRQFLVFWASWFGRYVNTVLKLFPWIFALVNAVQLDYTKNVNASVLAGIGLFSWLYTLVIHHVFTQRLIYHVRALDMEHCFCNSIESCKAVYKKDKRCPGQWVKWTCGVKRGSHHSEEKYEQDCIKVNTCKVTRQQGWNDYQYAYECKMATFDGKKVTVKGADEVDVEDVDAADF